MNIRIDDLTNSKVQQLLREHLGSMAQHSPPESVHALDLDGLRNPVVTFWCAWDSDELLGCGALKELTGQHGEIKSMRTSKAHLRKGVAGKILQHIIDVAVRRGYQRISLETGTAAAFEPARALYSNFGFLYCGRFADYGEDPYSVFMTREL